MTNPAKVRENRLRRMAERQGLTLQKSRSRDPQAIEYGMYWILDPATNSLATFQDGDWELGLSLDEVEDWLTTDKDKRATSPMVR